jgi:hypothetical protein
VARNKRGSSLCMDCLLGLQRMRLRAIVPCYDP